MAITPQQARAELARRELARRGVPLEAPQQPINRPYDEDMLKQVFAKAHPVMAGAEKFANFMIDPIYKSAGLTGGKTLTEVSQQTPIPTRMTGNPMQDIPSAIGMGVKGLGRDIAATGVDMVASPMSVVGMAAKPVSSVLGTVKKGFGEFQEARKTLPRINKEISNIQKMYGLEKTDDKYVLTKINEIRNRKRLDYNFKKDEFNVASKNEIEGLKSEYDKLKNTLLRGKTIDFADFMKKEGPAWIKKGSDRYGLSLERFSKFVDEEAPVSVEEAYNFVNNNIKNIEQTGIETPVLGYLRSIRDKYGRLYEDGVKQIGNIPVEPGYAPQWPTIPFKQIKAEISGVYNHISSNLRGGRGVDASDIASMNVARSWSDLLKSKLPEKFKKEFETLQSQYRPFAEAKSMMGQMFEPYSGTLKIDKASRMAENFALNEKNENLKRLMDFMQKGEADFIDGIPGIGEKASELSQLGSKIKSLKEAIPVVRRSKETAQALYKKELRDQLNELEKWQVIYQRLSAERAFHEKNVNNVLKFFTYGGIGAGAIGGYKAYKDLSR